MSPQFDRKNKDSVIAYAKKLIGKSLRQACGDEIIESTYLGKGDFGQLLEKFYFGYEPNSISEPDFSEIGIELKSSPLKQLKNKEYRSKERLVLNIINYQTISEESFEASKFLKKSAHLLLIFYLHQESSQTIDLIVKLVNDWQFPETDLQIIKKDWEKIRQKILIGKAHELSEGDTLYLGACTKGGKGGNERIQPFSDVPAKQRAFSLKQGYVNHIIASIAKEKEEIYGKLISSALQVKKQTLEEIVIQKFQPYYDNTPKEIINKIGVTLNDKAKGFYASLSNAILGFGPETEIEEFEKAEITIRTIRLKEDLLPKENISFPAFRFEEIINEDWDTSQLRSLLERKFLFIFYQIKKDKTILKNVKFWNMPYEDILEAKKVWKKTREVIEKGTIIQKYKGKIRLNYFPKSTENRVMHVRPHGANADDCYRLPFPDILSGATEFTKQGFWLNATYVRDILLS